jgi:hypothetical protein
MQVAHAFYKQSQNNNYFPMPRQGNAGNEIIVEIAEIKIKYIPFNETKNT